MPFLRILEQRGMAVPPALLESIAADPDARVPISVVEQHLADVFREAGDPQLGIVAGQSMVLGDCPAIDYAMATARTVREAVEVALQHARLCSDALAIDLQVDGAKALLRLESSTALSRIAADFLVVGMFTSHISTWPLLPDELECWFLHEQPGDVSAYEAALPGARLRFNAPCYGFSFNANSLDATLRSADPKLHAVVQRYADLMLAELPSTQTLAGDIRRMLPAELARSRADAASVARKLHVSVRTLGRRLEEEGTSFKVLLNDVRRELALNMLVRGDLPIADVARQLDFADVSTFHRAFRRWTGQTPATYRASHSMRRLGNGMSEQQAS